MEIVRAAPASWSRTETGTNVGGASGEGVVEGGRTRQVSEVRLGYAEFAEQAAYAALDLVADGRAFSMLLPAGWSMVQSR
jgi:hypothetical protein